MNRFLKVHNNACEAILSKAITIGSNVVLGPRCKKIKIGFGCFIGNDIYIDVDCLDIGDFTTIHHGSIIHGLNTKIGHNCWIGHYTIIDSLGGDTKIGNNVGVGAHSQLWSHMKFGDTLQGCRWNSSSRLYLDDDVWLVGHSIVGPIHAKTKSMLMTGSVAVKDMEENSVYAGSPAKNLTKRFGPQFEEITCEEKLKRFLLLRSEFCKSEGVDEKIFKVVNCFSDRIDVTQFNIQERTYKPIRSIVETHFIRFMLYDKAKWLPVFDD
jgi:acetyltransferase-like isoleucine patch superfamily enzyme